MKDLAGLLVSIHRLGGLTKFTEMHAWISSLSGKLIEEALVCISVDDYELLDTLANDAGFLRSMVTDQVCYDIVLNNHIRVVGAL
jgi:hypothetical protein